MAALPAKNDHESDRCSHAQAMRAGTRKRALPAEHGGQMLPRASMRAQRAHASDSDSGLSRAVHGFVVGKAAMVGVLPFTILETFPCSPIARIIARINARMHPTSTHAILHVRLVWAVPSLAASCALAAALAASRTSQKKKCVPSPRQSAHSGAGRAVQHNRRNGRNSQLILVSIHFFRCQVLGACKKKEFLRVSHREK